MTNTNILVRILLLALGLVLLVACKSDIPNDASDSQAMIRKLVHHDGAEREYFVHMPQESRNSPVALPVVIAFHGYGGTATGFQRAYDLNAHADTNGYIIVYPQGTHFQVKQEDVARYRVTSWNDLAANQPPMPEGPQCTDDRYQYPCPPECGECGQCGWTSCYDDVGFVDEMLVQLESDFPVDDQRIYLLGVSNGGMLALRLGCNLTDRFAAVVPINAQLARGYACGPSGNLPMLHLVGELDDTVRPDGSAGATGFIYASAQETASIWADAMSCERPPRIWQNEYVTAIGLSCTAYTNCAVENQEVVSCVAGNLKHEWPGQRVAESAVSCVAEEQYDSLPGQSHCPSYSPGSQQLGMDLVWGFMRQFRNASSNNNGE